MRTLLALTAVAAFTTAAWAKVWTTVYRHDEKTPLEMIDSNNPRVYRDIMVGTHLTIVVSSDQTGQWYGDLIVDGGSISYGVLDARGLVELPMNYPGSCLYAAGDFARILPHFGPEGHGFSFMSTRTASWRRGAVPGDWFILDYYAQETGPCQVEFYEDNIYSSTSLETFSFTHVPSRDFHADNIVDLRDFSLLACQWRTAPAPDPNDPAIAMDLNTDGCIDANDLTLFTDFWLERTDAPRAVVDPNRN